MKRVREWISVKIVKAPGAMVLLGILFANVVIIGTAGFVISSLAPPSLENRGFWGSVYHTVTMILGVGGVENLVENIGQANVVYVLCCVSAVIIGLIVFTGAIIGYMSELISSFIENADSGSRKLHLSNHIVILNWNTRAAEIINEMLHKNTREKVVVLVSGNRDGVLSDIDERLSDTMDAENDAVREACAHMRFFRRRFYRLKHSFRNKLTIIVREGDPWSTKQLSDISIQFAKSVIILSSHISSILDRSGHKGRFGHAGKGDSLTIKTMLQIVQMTSEEESIDNQKVIVEAEDDWTLTLAHTIIGHKAQAGKHNIIPVPVNRILGQIFSQFAIMPELNLVYSTLFSHKGAAFYTQSVSAASLSEEEFVSEHLDHHLQSIPLTAVRGDDGKYQCYYMSTDEQYIRGIEPAARNHDLRVSLNPDFMIKDRHIVMMGHNSKTAAIMGGFDAFREEWKKKDGTEVLDVIVIDDEESLVKQNHYKQYPYVAKVISADIFNKDLICSVIDEFIGAHNEGGCIMILSDDTAPDEEFDANALTYLVLVQDILHRRSVNTPGFDPCRIDMVVEILNPKNFDIVSSYSRNNIVISNRYISKIVMQIGEKDSLFHFYNDILTYDDPNMEEAVSKELYIKKAADFFNELPGACTAADLIRAVYRSSPNDNRSVVLGYFRPDGEMILFAGDQSNIRVALSEEDKLIVFSNH
ncbi:MAG: hypothetical protein FWF86_04945 [Clostridia bacterium]|nr:hypothetical protein [Clostridia bacterium]